MTVKIEELGQAVLTRVASYLSPKGMQLVQEAYAFAAERHAGQRRKSGDPAITHPLHAAETIANLQLDASTIAAALRHDVQEDCGVTNQEIAKRFGSEVAVMVEGVTKLGLIGGQAAEARSGEAHTQAENLRKMFLAMAQDLRVVIIKLADRLHNMKTLWALKPDDQRRIARETMEIYAPLAARLGIWDIKWQLEDLSFRYLQPDDYKFVADLIDAKRGVRETYVTQVTDFIREELKKHSIQAEIQGRAKHIYSIHSKMEKYAAEGKSVDEIYDLLAVRVLVETVTDCYTALGVVHGLWRPLPGSFDDYIANPKESMYQSLHTTVMALNTPPLDFAYRIHTDLGHHCVGAKVNGRLVSLNYQLKNGEVIEVLTSRSSKGPSRDWMNSNLGFIRTTHAREKIRQWFKRQERAENIARGKEMVEKELRRLGASLGGMEEDILKLFKLDDLEDFFLRVGYGEISAQHISTKLASLLVEETPAPVEEIPPPAKSTYTTSISVLGTGDLLTRLARCCNPVPGDKIMGYVTRGEGVSVHRADCRNLLNEDEKERLVDVEWGRRGQLYPVAVHIDAWDRVGLLRDISTMVAEEKVNMVGVHTEGAADGHITIYVTLEMAGVEQLTRLLTKLEGIRGVVSVSRRVEGARKRA